MGATFLNASGSFLEAFAALALESAPFLLLGLVLAGLIQGVLPQRAIMKVLGGRGFGSIFRAALIGMPIPLCSCGVLPAAVSLRRAGASRGATSSFLVSTPENGLDSIGLSYALLGGPMTIVRVIAATIAATVTGVLVHLFGREPERSVSLGVMSGSCCEPAAEASSCCSSAAVDGQAGAALRRGFLSRAFSGMRYAFGKVLLDIAGWLIVGLLAAAAVVAFVPQELLATYGNGLLGMLLVLAISVPMYICAAGSTPVAAALMAAGMSPGTALVFLLAGPATNIGSFGVLKRELGLRSASLFVGGVAASSVAMGLAVDALMPVSWFASLERGAGLSGMPLPMWVHSASTALLGLALLAPGVRRTALPAGVSEAEGELGRADASPA